MDFSSQSPSSNGYEDWSHNINRSNSPSTSSSEPRPSLHHSRSLPLGAQLSSTPSPSYDGSTMSSDWTGQAELGSLWRDEGIPGGWAGEHQNGGRSMDSSFLGGYDEQHHQLVPPPPSSAAHQGTRTDFLSGRSSSSNSHPLPQNHPSPFDDSPYLSWQESLSRSSTPSSDTFPSSPSHLQSQQVPPPPPQPLRHPLSQSNFHYSHEINSTTSIGASRRTSQPELRNASNSSSSSNLVPHFPRQPTADVARRGSLPSGRFAGGLVVPESYHQQPGGGGGSSRGVHTLRQVSSSSDATVRRGSLPDGLASAQIALPPSAVRPTFTSHQYPYQLQSSFNMGTFDAQPAESRSFGNRRMPLLRSVSDSSSSSNNGPLPLSYASPTSQYPGERNLPSSLSALSVQSPTSTGYGQGGGGLQLRQPPSNPVSPSRPCFPVAEEEEVPMQTEGFDGDWEKADHPLHHRNSSEKMARGRSDASSVPSRQSHWPAPISTTELRNRAFSTASSSSSSGISTPNYHLSPGVTPNSALHAVPSVLYSFSPSNEGGVPSPHYLEYQHQQQQQQHQHHQHQSSSIVNNFAPPPQDSSTFRTRAKRSASAPGPSLLSIRETSSFSSSNNDPMITDAPKPIESASIRHVKPEWVLGQAQPAEELEDDQEEDDGLSSSSEEEEDDDEADDDFVEKESRSTDPDEEMTESQSPYEEEPSARVGSDDEEEGEGEEEMDQSESFSPSVKTRSGRSRPRARTGRKSNKSSVPAGNRFPDKLYVMANASSSLPHVDWSPDGNSMIIPDPEGFASAVLHRYFKHDKLSSFLRQLNIYGFTRIRNPFKGEDGKEQKDGKKSLEFSHPNFLRGREDLVALVVRNSAPLGRSGRKDPAPRPPLPPRAASPAVVDTPSPVVEEPESEPEPEPEPEPEVEVREPSPPPPPPRPPTPPPPEPLTYEQLQEALDIANSTISSLSGHLRATDRRRIELEHVALRLRSFVGRRCPPEQLHEIADLFPRPSYNYSSPPNRYPPTSAPHSQHSFNLSIPSHQPLASATTPSPTLSSYSGGHQVYNSHSSSSSALSLLAPPSSANPSETSPSSGFFLAHDHQHLDGSFSPTKRPRLSPGGTTGLVYENPNGEPVLLSPSEKTPTSQHASSSSRPALPRKTSSKTLRVGSVGGSSIASRRRTSSNNHQQHVGGGGGGLGLIDQPILNFGLEQPSHGVKVEEMDDNLMGDALKTAYMG